MKIAEMLALALALSMDALAVAIASGYAIKRLHLHYAMRIAVWFGAAQMLMPILGWLGGRKIQSLVAAFDHWLIFGVLTFIGGKMIYESFVLEKVERPDTPMGLHTLLILSLATSLDAFSVGFSLSLLDVAIITPALVIGAATFALSLAGVFIGDRAGRCCENKIEIAGGLILIGIGVRILWQQLR